MNRVHRVKILWMALLLAILSVPAQAQLTTFLPANSGATMMSLGQGSALSAYGQILTTTSTQPGALANFGFTQNGVLTTEAGIAASSPTTAIRVFVDYMSGVADSGVGIVNPSSNPITLNVQLNNPQGSVTSCPGLTIPAGGHLAAFASQLCQGSISNPFLGTLTLTSSTPFAATNLQMAKNSHEEPLYNSLPVAIPNAPPNGNRLYFSQFVDGGGFRTELLLMNLTDTAITGTVSFFDNNGQPLTMNFESPVGSVNTLNYSISGNGMHKFATGSMPGIPPRVGYAVVTSGSGALPSGAVVFSCYSATAGLASVAGVLNSPLTTSSRMYIEKTSSPLIHNTGIGIVNPNSSPATVRLQLASLDGSFAASNTLTLAANTHVATFIDQAALMGDAAAAVAQNFRGVLTLSSDLPVAPVTLRFTPNQLGEDLYSALPVVDMNNIPTGPLYLPQIADGDGYTTQIILINTGSSSGTVTVHFPDGNGSVRQIPFAAGPGNAGGTMVSVYPNRSAIGRSLNVILSGADTHFVQGQTRVSFGPGISVGGAAEGQPGPVTVVNSVRASAQLAINPAAAIGPRDITVTTGTLTTSLYNDFFLTSSPAFNMVLVASGDSHGLTVKNDGTVWAWGYNTTGQLGNGTTSNSTIPVQVIGLTNAVAVAAGMGYSMALRSDGTVWAWGQNYYGQLGNGTTVNSLIPVRVPELTNVVAIAAGEYQSLALKSDGTAWTWGYNFDTELGNGTNNHSAVPVQVQGITNIVAIAGGYMHSLALKGDGTVWAWGANDSGQLGNGTTNSSAIPMQVQGLTNIVAVTAGRYHSLAVKNDGTVWAWGYNVAGQLGNGTTNNSSVPVQAQNLANVVAVAAGCAYSLALEGDGTVWAWGDNSYGELGNGTNSSSSLPVQAQSLSNILVIAAGLYHSYALKGDATIWAWGNNYSGQLGNGTNNTSYSPLQVGNRLAPAVTTGTATNVTSGTARLNGAVQSNGQTTTAYFEWGTGAGYGNRTSEQSISGGIGSSGISASLIGLSPNTAYHFRLAAGNNVGVTYGSDQSFITNSGNDATPSVHTEEATSVASNAAMLNATINPNGLTTTVYFEWGTDTSYGNCTPTRSIGSGAAILAVSSYISELNSNTTYHFRIVASNSAGTSNGNDRTWVSASTPVSITQIAGGGSHNLALRSNGAVWAWGNNYSGQLGYGTASDSSTSVQVQGLTHIIAVAGGAYHSLALKNDGIVWAWGNNRAGQLGDGTTNSNFLPLQVQSLTNVASIAAGSYHSLALKSDGTVWAWGINDWGQLGNGKTDWSALPVQVQGLTDIIAITGGEAHSAALKRDGTVWAWGYNWSGQPLDSTTKSLTPVQVQGLTNVVAINAGNHHTLAIKSDGTVWAWGSNNSGQLGNGTTRDSFEPMLVQNLTHVIAVAGGALHSLALKDDGTVWIWGSGNASPAQVQGLFNILAVAAGNYLNLALKSDDTIWTWNNGSAPMPISLGFVVPTVSTGTAAVISSNTTTLIGTVNPNGLATTTYFQWGAGTGYENSTIVQSLGSGTGVLTISANLSGLSANTTYHYRIIATNSVGTGYGNDQVWTTATANASTVLQIAAGAYHSLALRNDGSVWAWGGNEFGQLGNGTTGAHSSSVQVQGLNDILAIAAGTYHSLALKNDGTVWAWGVNYGGQLGNGTTNPSSVPVRVQNLTHAIAIAGGAYHSLAIKDDGTVWAWGSNNYGQLGNGTTFDSSEPVQVSGLANIIAVAGGGTHSLALRNNGTVWAWGDNDSGQLGNGTISNSRTPVQVQGLTGVYAIACGQWHSLAIKSDGTVWTWGNNEYGQLGDGTTFDSSIPVQAQGLNNIAAIMGGAFHSVALKSDGTVWTWGRNSEGQLGNGTVNEYSSPVQVQGLKNIVSVAAGAFHSLALKNDGTAWAWGRNSESQLGNGSTGNRVSPVQSTVCITTPTASTQTASIITLSTATLNGTVNPNGLDTTTYFQWGKSTDYGNSTTAQSIGSGSSPLPISANLSRLSSNTTYHYRIVAINSAGTSNGKDQTFITETIGSYSVIKIAAGGSHSLALNADGTVWAWGDNNFGQLGNGAGGDSPAPGQVQGLTGIIAVAGGADHSLALRSDGTVWAWGRNWYGELGNGITINSSVPVEVSGLTNVTAVAASGSHSMALKSDGTVWAWGDNANGQLGNGSTTTSLLPAQVQGLGNAVAVATGAYHSLALKNDGTVWAWGDNWSGELGNGSTTNSLVPVKVSGLTNVLTIAAGGAHSLAFNIDGMVWAWGSNSAGQLGKGTSYDTSVLPVQVQDLTDVVAAAAGLQHSLAVKRDSTVWGWGSNYEGELGNEALGQILLPIQIQGMTNVTMVTAGWNHSLALKSDGTVWAWGKNADGQIGNGTTVRSFQPVQVDFGIIP
jgi:alpha-tubulin suppressor-like RCC1 family protein